MQRLKPLDESFLHLETDCNLMHVGALAVFEGPPPRFEDVAALVTGKLPRIPRYRQRVRFVPLALGRPRWVDDRHFNLGYHLRHTALPAPGGPDQLRNLVGRVMSQRLDRARPLWEMWMIEGLEGGRWALLYKLHHAMVDGVSGTDLLIVVLDRKRDAPALAPEPWEPQAEPGGLELVGRALLERPAELADRAVAAARAPRRLAAGARDTARGLGAMSALLRPGRGSSLNGPVGPHRAWTWSRARLADVKVVRRALGGTVNDVLLTMATAGLRELMLSRGEPVERRSTVRSLVPVSLRSAEEHETYDNRVSAMFAELPVGIEDPTRRLRAVRFEMGRLKGSHEAAAAGTLTSLTGLVPPMVLAAAERVLTHVPQHTVNTVTTNVPGPQFPLYAVGRRMLEAFPYVPVAGHVRVGMAIFSYDGQVNVGITGDWEDADDLEILARGIENGLGELLAAAAKDDRRSEARAAAAAIRRSAAGTTPSAAG